ncbi:PREDICTED: protein TIME FOR COFFEE-like isoform X2 [Tarenaya hassleriana]|uniref:protein TIME FOR COFFEE-like isoform X2 n=1 Tax=Tarenaya hassleriana TaxID=28532 RepID=UPI00053C3D90|nr:PREDICTED: protein TIME FOR COFFEE-like isoform X2 [Tarenaya hassleriana]
MVYPGGDREAQEGVTLRDRPEKKERDRESLNRSKRRRSDRFVVKNEIDAEEDSSDESLDDEDIPISHNSASSQPNHLRKSFPPARVPRHAMAKTGMDPSLQAADDMIGVPVPRKARSACIKRAHDCRTSSGSGGGGYGDDHRRPPASPASYSFEAASPSSSIVSAKQKMNVNRSKFRVLKPLKSPGTMEDDLEFEIAEVLSGLKKQPRKSKKEEDSDNPLKSSELKDSKKMETKADDSSAHVDNDSITYTARTEAGNSGNIEISMAKPEKPAGFYSISHRTAGTEGVEASCAAMDTEIGAQKQEQLDSPDGVLERKRQDSTAMKGGREESYANNKLELCLVVPPPMASSPERDSLPSASGSNPIAQDYNKLESSEKSNEKAITKKDTSLDEIEEKGVQNRDWLTLDLQKQSHDTVRDSSLGLRNQGQNQQLQAKSAQPSSDPPLPIAAGGWPNGLPPPTRYVSQLHAVKPVDGITGSPKLQTASQPRPKRCATHFFIARNIQLHQQFVKTNHVWVPNQASVSSNGGGSTPSNLCVVPPTAAEGLIHGNPSMHGSFPILNLNSLAQDKGKIVANVPSQKDKAYGSGNSAEATQKKPQLPSAPSNLAPAPAFIFPMNNHQHLVMGAANQSVPCKSSGPTKNPSLASGSTSVSFSYPSSSTSGASQYLTILPNNGYSFQVSTGPASTGGATGPVLPFFNGSLYPPQMLQPPQLLQKQGQTHKETSTSSGSSSSHRQPHSQIVGSSNLSLANVQKQRLQSTAHQSQKPEMKTREDNSSLVSDFRGSRTLTVPVQPLNSPMPFASYSGSGAPASLNFTSNGYRIVHSPQAGQQKNQQQQSDGKTGGCSTVSGKATPTPRKNGQTLAFDNSARTLNFMSGTWSSSAVTVAASTQKHRQASGRSKLMDEHSLPATSLAAKFPNSICVETAKSDPAASPLASCSSMSIRQYQSQQPKGETQISFAVASPNNKTSCTVVSPPSSQQQVEKAASPVCGRNMMKSIISSCPSHLSELKY